MTIAPFPAKPANGGSSVTEQSVARDFVSSHGHILRFDHERGRWLLWDDHFWKLDRRKRAFFWTLEHCHALGIKKTERAGFANAVETIARAMPPIATCADDWNANPEHVATPGGVIDLATGAMRNGKPEDMIDRALAVTPDGHDRPDLWFQFLNRMFNGNGELIDFLQRWGGYCLSGYITEHKFIFLHGTGANGKGTLLSTLQAIWNDLCANAPIDVFLESQTDRHTTEIARLHGPHIVLVHETKEGRRWDEAKIKTMTGGDKLTARFMRHDDFEFEPRFKIMLAGNHKPHLRSVDEAIRRRLLLMPCTVTIPANQRDPKLGEKLRAEYPQILSWFIEGYQHWQKTGLRPPAAITDATEEYLAMQDDLQQWIEQCTEPRGYGSTPGQELFNNWKIWRDDRQEAPGPARTFFDKLVDKGYPKKKTNSGVAFEKIKIIGGP